MDFGLNAFIYKVQIVFGILVFVLGQKYLAH